MRLLDVDARGALEDLDDGFGATDLENLPATPRAIWQGERHDFIVLWELGVRRREEKEGVSGERERDEVDWKGIPGAP